jgi:hypothetical protein
MLADWLHDQFGGWMVCRREPLLLSWAGMQEIVLTSP